MATAAALTYHQCDPIEIISKTRNVISPLKYDFIFNSPWPSDVMWRRELGHSWFGHWLVALRHQAFNWTNIDLLPTESQGMLNQHIKGFEENVLGKDVSNAGHFCVGLEVNQTRNLLTHCGLLTPWHISGSTLPLLNNGMLPLYLNRCWPLVINVLWGIHRRAISQRVPMMTPSNGNGFRVTVPLSPVDSPRNGPATRALLFSLMLA